MLPANMISVHDIHFHYPNSEFRLAVPEFAVSPGEKIAVVGPSGSGKTTLLNLLAGILTPGQGKVRIGEVAVSDLGDAGRRDFRISNIGFVFQDFELLDYLSILDNILHPYRITGALKLSTEVRQRAIDLAEKMGIAGYLKKHPDELSQGEKQRAAICRALLPQPELILADEATGNLDPVNKTRILDLLFESVDVHNATLVAVTHDHELLPRFDRVIDFKEFQVGAGSKGVGAGEPEQGVRNKEPVAKSSKLQATDSKLQATDSKLQATDSKLQATDSKLQTPSSSLPAGEAL
jgi:ABC-type lipoprotein export system ATPase subunit